MSVMAYVFSSEANALTACDEMHVEMRICAAAAGYTVDGSGYVIGKSCTKDQGDDQRTECWDIPVELTDLRWAILSCRDYLPSCYVAVEAAITPVFTYEDVESLLPV
jgi:hypothetical protein